MLFINYKLRIQYYSRAIMDAIIDKQEEFRGTSSFLNARMVQNSNTVRLYLKCTFTSDLKNHATNKMHENLYAVTAPRTTSEVYAYQPRPSDVAISDWQRCIRLAFLSGDRNMPSALIEKPELMEMPPPKTFTEFCASQPQSVQNIVGRKILSSISEHDTATFAQLLDSTDAIAIFGDGSVKDGRGAHSTRIYANNEFADTTPSIESSAITSGDPTTITSLRSETSLVLSELYILQLLSVFYSIPLDVTVHFYYDNCESLRRVDALEEFEYFADPMATDYDIWAEMKRIPAILPITHHVKAHQHDHKPYQDLLPRDAQVNCDMDRAAEAMRESTMPAPPIPIFQSNKIAILLSNIVLTDQISKRLRHHFTAPPLQ